MTRIEMEEIAQDNIDSNLCDALADYGDETISSATLYTEAYTLAFDALADAGLDNETAREVAAKVASVYGRPE